MGTAWESSFEVTVAETSGTKDFYLGGGVDGVIVAAPSAEASYEWEILDADSIGRASSTGSCTGDSNNARDFSLPNGTYTFRIFNAADGVYKATIVMYP